MLRRMLAPFIIGAIALVVSACDPSDPAQRQAFYDLNPEYGAEVTPENFNEPQRAVIAHIQAEQGKFLAAAAAAQARPRDCYSAMEQVFPPSTWSWGRSIIHRESRNQPGAQNPSSSAAGCWQLIMSLHSHRFYAVGCSPADRYDALCNTKAAYHLYQAAGTSPWRVG